MNGLLLIGWILLVCCSAALVFWIVAWMRVSRYVKDRPTVRAGLAAPPHSRSAENVPSLSIIVPAHNEEAVISACCRSLTAQDYGDRRKLEFIFVLDRCTDRTAEIVRDLASEDDRILIIENDSCPPDWAGKCNAARLGAERATGDFLLFTDADTEFDPALCRAALKLAIDRELALVSLLSTLTYQQTFEKVAQPVATMHLMRLYPPMRQQSDLPARPFANGQFMLFPRLWYERIGGHAAVKDDLLEDLALARRIQEEGGRGAVLLADGMLRCAMYDSLDGFREGWKRIFIEACRRKPKRLRKNAWRILATGAGVPLIQLVSLAIAAALFAQGVVGLSIAMGLIVLAGWAVQFSTLGRAYALGGAPISAVIYYPVGCWIVAKAMLDGANDLEQRRPVRWGGREYVLEPRG